jgi:ribose transport system permease protein
MTATGEAGEAARLAGIATARVKRRGLTLSGLLAGLTGLLLAANLAGRNHDCLGGVFVGRGQEGIVCGYSSFDFKTSGNC